MRMINLAIVFIMLSFASMTVLADAVEPVIQQNVTVLKNATPDQCPASYKSSGGVDQQTNMDGAGMQTEITSPGVTSCSDCSIVNGDCVCKTCYTNFDE